MSLQLIANTVGKACAKVAVTDASNVDVAASEMKGVSNVLGGPRHLRWYQTSGTAARRLHFVDTNGGLEATHLVIVDLKDNAAVPTFDVLSYSAWPGSSTTEVTSVGLPTCTGPNGKDYVVSLGSLTGKEGFAVLYGTGVTKSMRQHYFGKAIQFDDVADDVAPLSWEPVPVWEAPVQHGNHHYHLSARASITVTGLTQSTLDEYFSLDRDQPVFFYDDEELSSGVGVFIDDQLWHCIILSEEVTVEFDDRYTISFSLGILRYW